MRINLNKVFPPSQALTKSDQSECRGRVQQALLVSLSKARSRPIETNAPASLEAIPTDKLFARSILRVSEADDIDSIRTMRLIHARLPVTQVRQFTTRSNTHNMVH